MKPRIIKGWGGRWWCINGPDDDGWVGVGNSMIEAYQDWKAKNNK